jgi:cbb3-type cytochrome oxidase subunit 1
MTRWRWPREYRRRRTYGMNPLEALMWSLPTSVLLILACLFTAGIIAGMLWRR